MLVPLAPGLLEDVTYRDLPGEPGSCDKSPTVQDGSDEESKEGEKRLSHAQWEDDR